MLQYESEWKIEEVSVEQIVRKYGTPCYVYSAAAIEHAIQKAFLALEGLPATISFACKANDNPLLLNFLQQRGLWMDVVTMGEYQIALRSAVKPEHMIVNGNAKTIEDITQWWEAGVHAINIDSVEEYTLIADNGFKSNDRTHFFLRVNPDVDAKTHPYISTGLKKNKFGIPLETAQEILTDDRISIMGIHMHIGSSLMQIEPYIEALEKLLHFKEKNPQIQFLNIGGGWGIDYTHTGKDFDLDNYRKKVLPLLKSFECPILAELGRFIIGGAGVLLSKVIYRKQTPYKQFVVCDANMATLIRPALYAAEHQIVPLISKEEKRELLTVDVVGGLCESGDILALGRRMKEVLPGETIAILDTGAYGYSMASNYNGTLKPAEILIQGEKSRMIRKRETIDDLMRLVE